MIKEYIRKQVQEVLATVGHFIMDEAFVIAVGASLVCMLLVMFGSVRAKVWLYWTIAGYILVEVGKAVLTA